jgi:endonuclease G
MKFHFWISALFLVWITSSHAQSQYLQKHSSNGEIINHTFYSLSYLEDHEQAEWVTYRLFPAFLKGNAIRKNNFRPDPLVQTKSANSKDYSKSGYDRGHLAAAGDMVFSKQSMSESFFYSNIAPQKPSFNRGAWKNLESLVRQWGNSFEIIVVTGGILSGGNLDQIGPNGVSVPKEFYKIVYAPEKNEMLGFIMPNQKIINDIWNYSTTVDEIEELTCIDFFIELNDEIENLIESRINVDKWQRLRN